MSLDSFENSEYGVLYKFPQDDRVNYQCEDSKVIPLKIHRSFRKIDNNSVEVSLLIENVSDKRLRMNSAVIFDTVLEVDIKDIEKILVNGWVQSSDSTYCEKIIPTKEKKLILKRDQNPYSFKNEFGYIKGSMVSEWYTHIILKEKSIFIGASTIDKQFCQFYLKEEINKLRVRATAQFDGITLAPRDMVNTESIFITIGDENDTRLYFADQLQQRYQTRPSNKIIKGLCCAYYAQGNDVNIDYVAQNIRKLDEFVTSEKSNIVVEIDAGYCKWGDWLETNNSFGGNLQHVCNMITNHGYVPGIWISPFVVMKESRIYKTKQDWFIRDNGKPLEARQTSPLDILPQMGLYVLDVTKEDVQNYIRNVVREFYSIGFRFIKIDFLYPSCFAQSYSKNVTRAQAIRMGVETIRNSTPKDMQIVSAISHLSPLVGLVDYARVGLDTTNPMIYGIPIVNKSVNEHMLKHDLMNYDTRGFYDEKIWINDIDCFVANPGSGLSQNLIDQHFCRIMNSKARWIGDDLTKLDQSLIEKYILPILNQ